MPKMRSWVCALALACGCDRVLGLDAIPGWTAVTASDAHTCAIREDRSLWCWGDNTYGQLGVGTLPTELDSPGQVTGRWRTVATGSLSTCAIDTASALWCWGDNSYGELGIGNAFDSALPEQLDGTWTQVSVGGRHACGIRDDGSLWCWGDNATYGALGLGNDGSGKPVPSRFSPTQVGSATWKSVSAGHGHTCAIRDDDSLWCWGRNNSFELGTGVSAPFISSPVLVGTGPWAQVVTGGTSTSDSTYGTTCGRLADGRVECWGDGAFGTIGNGTRSLAGVPTDVTIDGSAPTDWIDVALTGLHACGRRADHSLWCWGDDSRGQLAVDLPDAVATSPQQVGSGTRWAAVAGGVAHTCALSDDHRLWCFGSAARGQLGNQAGSALHPTLVSRGPWAQVSAGAGHTCVVDDAGQVACGGDDRDGQLGDGALAARDELAPIAGLALSTITCGTFHTCGIAADASLWCWGFNTDGALGDGGAQRIVATPEHVAANLTWKAVAASMHTCAIAAVDGSIWCWGYGPYGQLGDGSMASTANPVQVSGGPWTAVATSADSTCALDAGGQLWCWGYNHEGQLANGTDATNTTMPVRSVSAAPFATLAGAGYQACALAADHTAQCWGGNDRGQLGLGNNAEMTSPTPLAGAWRVLAMGQYHTCGIRGDDGALLCWGANDRGQLGDGTLLDRFSPTQIGTDTDWRAVTAGTAHTCALKTDGSLWCWGADDSGQLLDGHAWTAMPVELP